MALSFKLLTCACLLAIASASAAESLSAPEATADGLGLTKAAAIEVCMPAGERQYLARLVCPGNEHPAFERIGSVGERNPTDNLSEQEQERLLDELFEPRPMQPGDTDYHMLDAYQVTCEGTPPVTLYLDMYHCEQEAPAVAPAGFSLMR